MKVLKPGLVGAKNRYNTNYDNRYYAVNLMKNDGTSKIYKVHRLVALHFLVNPRLHNVVDHIDNNKLNNKASNLRWVTYKENSNNPNSNKIKAVARYTLDGKYIDERPSIQSYTEEFGFDKSSIVNCLKGRYKSAYDYKWQYLDKQGYLENF